MNKSAIEADLLGMVLQSGNSALSEPASNIIHVDSTKLNKMAGTSKMELKRRSQEKEALLQSNQELQNLREVFNDVFIKQDVDPDYEQREFDPTDYFIV